MACNFSANQFEREFKAPKLCNWQVPKYHPANPEQRFGGTKIIANDRGHLLPGVSKPTTCPWGHFKGTWQLPEKITFKTARELHAPPIGGSRWAKSSKCSHKKNSKLHNNEEQENYDNEDNSNVIHKEQKEIDLEYTPGDLTSSNNQHQQSRQLLLQQKHDRKIGREPILKLNDLYLEKHECTDRVSLLNDEKANCCVKIPNILEDIKSVNIDNKMSKHRNVTMKPTDRESLLSPIVPAYCNFQMAKKMAQENLEHQPLPDAVADKAYRRLQAQGILHPGMILDIIPTVTGVGVKSHKAGPTQCTKLRVYRPRTCGIVPKPLEKSKISNRPQTCFEKKGNMGQMDLAICWDYRPVNPNDEPKPPTHIDGSNGSSAPAVFTLVKTPKSGNNLETGRSGGFFTNTLGDENFFDKDVVRQHQYHKKKHSMERLCDCGNSVASWKNTKDEEIYRPRSSTRNESQQKHRERCKSSPNLSVIAHASHEAFKENINRCQHDERFLCLKQKPDQHQNRRNSGDLKKTLRLCHQITPEIKEHKIVQKPIYKAAFKTGIPNSNSSGTCTSFDSGCTSSSISSSTKTVHVPKPRHPYANKNYTISSLIPPFACWRGGAGQGGYPEHWRLASVYQHAYKPIEQRKRPLLATVYQ